MAVQLPKTIRQWFTRKQACDYLSQAFECEVTHDILKRDYKGFIFESFRTTTDYNHTFTAHLEMDAHLRNALQMVFEVDDANFYTIEYKIPQGIYTLTEFYENDFHLNAYYLDFSNITATVTDIFDNIERVIQLNDIKIPSYLVLSDDDAERVSNQYGESAIVGEFGYPRHELDRFIKAQTEPTPETKEPKELNPTERQSLHTIIKTLANFIIDPSAKPEKEKSDNERGKPPFKNQTQLIEFLSDKEQGMGEVRGFSKANLEKVFSKNNKSE